MSKDFHSLNEAEKFDFVNHNEKDFESFRNFQNELDAKYRTFEKEKVKAERVSNVKKWDKQLPPRWSGSDLKTIEHPAANVAEQLIKKHRFGSFYIKGNAGVGKTYLSFAIIRRYISLGYLSPSQVKIISEESLLTIPKLGFGGHERFDKLLSPHYKIYLFDNVSVRKEYDKRENPLWEQLLDHIYSKNLAAIFTSIGSARVFSEKLSGPASSKFGHLIDGKIIEMSGNGRKVNLDDLTDDEEADYKAEEEEVGLFNAFSEK